MKAYLVGQGSNYSRAFARKMSRLHVAADAGAANVVKSLLNMSILLNVESGLNARDSYGQTPLCWAAQMEQGSTVKLILEDSCVNVDLRNYGGRTPLSLAADAGNAYIVEQLLKRSANPNLQGIKQSTPLWYPARAGHGAIVELLLLTRGITLKTLNWTQPDDWSDDSGQGGTPLSIAAQNGHAQVVRLLLGEAGINPYKGGAEWYDNTTPLRVAVVTRNEDVAELLLEKSDLDPDPQNRDKAGRELLAHAAGAGSTRIFQLLLTKHKVNPNPWVGEGSALTKAAILVMKKWCSCS
jgi:ankyrin repeat protein